MVIECLTREVSSEWHAHIRNPRLLPLFCDPPGLSREISSCPSTRQSLCSVGSEFVPISTWGFLGTSDFMKERRRWLGHSAVSALALEPGVEHTMWWWTKLWQELDSDRFIWLYIIWCFNCESFPQVATLYLKMILTRCFICKYDCFIISRFLKRSRSSCNGSYGPPALQKTLRAEAYYPLLPELLAVWHQHTLSYLCTYGSIFNYNFGLLRWDLADWPETHCVAQAGLFSLLRCKPSCPAQFDTFWDVKITLFLRKLLRAQAVTVAAVCCLVLSWVPDFARIGWRRLMFLPLLVLELLVLGGQHFSLFASTADYLSIARLLFYSSLLLPGPLVSACWTLCPIIDTEKQLLTGCPLPADGSGAVYFTLRPQTCVSCWTAHKHVSQMCTAGLWQASSTSSFLLPSQETTTSTQSLTPRF